MVVEPGPFFEGWSEGPSLTKELLQAQERLRAQLRPVKTGKATDQELVCRCVANIENGCWAVFDAFREDYA